MGRAAVESHQDQLLGDICTLWACMGTGGSPMQEGVPGIQGGQELSVRGAYFRQAEGRPGANGQ